MSESVYETINYHWTNRENYSFHWRNEKFLNRSTNRAGVLRFFVPRPASLSPPRFHIELHTRKSFASGFEGARYKFDVDMDMESNISAYLVPSSFSRRSSSGRGCSFDFLLVALLRWQNRLWFVPRFNLKIVRRSKQYARKPFSHTPWSGLLRLYPLF